MKTIQNYFEYYLARIMAAFIGWLPYEGALAFGRGLGAFVYYCVPIRKKVVFDNLIRSFPEKGMEEIVEIARATYRNFGMNLIEFVRMPRLGVGGLEKRIRFVPQDLLPKARERGKGVICLSAHFGNWEMLAAAIPLMGCPVVAIAKDQRNPLVNEYILKNRSEMGIELVTPGIAVRGVLRALKENKFILLLADQDAHREGLFVDFLQRPSSTAPGPAMFALKTGAPLIFCTTVRNPHGFHTVYLEEVDHSDLDGATDENLHELTQRHARILERVVREHPEHWFWMHKRWKTKPPAAYVENSSDQAVHDQ